MRHIKCDVCRKSGRATDVMEYIKADLHFAGMMEYAAPSWKSWHLCDDCKDDAFYMILATREAMQGVDASITAEDFYRHAHALHQRINAGKGQT